MIHPSDQHIIEQLRANQSKGLQFLYQHTYPSVERYVQANQGTADEASDVFQDTLVIVLTKIHEPSFQLTASLKTYVFSISKHLWLQHLREKTRFATIPIDNLIEQADEQPEIPPNSSTLGLLGSILSSITVTCLSLLTALFFQRKSIDTLINEMGYANRHTVQNQKYKCLEQARRHGRDLLRKAEV